MADNGQQADGDKWGDEISKERKAWLEQRLHAWEQEADHGQRKGPFDRTGLSDEERAALKLSGADVFWLAARTLAGKSEAQAVAERMDLLRKVRYGEQGHFISGLNLSRANLQYASLSGAYLRGANLSEATVGGTLVRANMRQVNFTGAQLFGDLSEAVLDAADLSGAFLLGNASGARLWSANLSGVISQGLNLTGAKLGEANLTGATLREANLSEATLREANLTGTDLRLANLSGADMSEARLTVETTLTGASLSTTTLFSDTVWNNAPLARIGWETVPLLGDEMQARQKRAKQGKKKNAATRRGEYEAAVRAYRLLAVALRSQGLNEHADRYAYRAQLMQRVVQRLRRQYLLYVGSLLLGVLAGYGYRPLRTLFWYLAIICGFALAYVHFGHINGQPFEFDEALVFSVTSFHGRGFFPGTLSLKDLVTKLAAAEAVLGLFIEVSFIATFTQRYFGK